LDAEDAPEMAAAFLEELDPDEYPNLAGLAADVAFRTGYDGDKEFEFGLDVVLDSLERLLERHDAGDIERR